MVVYLFYWWTFGLSPVVSYLWNENWVKQKKNIPGVANGKLYAPLVHTLLGYLILNSGGLWALWASLRAQVGKNLPAVQEIWVWSLSLEDNPGEREWLPNSIFLPGEFHELRSVEGYSPWGCKESGGTEPLTFSHFFTSWALYCLWVLLQYSRRLIAVHIIHVLGQPSPIVEKPVLPPSSFQHFYSVNVSDLGVLLSPNDNILLVHSLNEWVLKQIPYPCFL